MYQPIPEPWRGELGRCMDNFLSRQVVLGVRDGVSTFVKP